MDELTNSRGRSFGPVSKLAGLALMIAGLSYIALSLILAVASHGLLPANGQQLFGYISAHGPVVEFAMAIFILKDMCVLAAFPVLAMVLGGWSKPALWLGTMLASIAMLFDILSSLIVIAFRRFSDSLGPAQGVDRSGLAILSEFIFRYVWRVETPFIVGLLSVAVILFSRTMLTGTFGSLVPRLGIILGGVGVAGAVLGFIQPVLLLSLWYIAVGFRLTRRI